MELYTPEEVAKILKVHVEVVRNMLRRGKLKGVKINRMWRVKKEDLEELIARGTEEASSITNERRGEKHSKDYR